MRRKLFTQLFNPQRTKLWLTVLLLSLMSSVNVWGQFTAGNLAVLAAAASSSNTTASIFEINKTSTSQTAITTTNISATGTDAIEVSGSASSTMYAANSNDGTLFCFTGHNSTATGNVNAIATRAVVTLNGSATFTKQTTYTAGTSGGTQTRGASTINNTNWYIGDQQGFYTNGGNSTNGSPSTNTRSIKAFGGTVYGFTSSATAPPVFTISGTSSTSYTNLSGLGNGATTRQDFYLISSGSNGSTFDVLYVLDASAAATGTIYKYSLVSGSWTGNGTYSTTVGGFGIIAEKSGTGANIYITTGTGATTANSVRKIVDGAGYNTTINVTGTSTLYTAATGVILKGLAFAPNKETLVDLNSSSTNHVIASPLTASNTIQPIFGFSLTSEGIDTMTALTLTVSRTISTSDISNVKLWSNTTSDYSTGTKTQLGSTVLSPSGTSISFSGFSAPLANASSTYYFVTCDVASGVASGTTAMQISLPNSGITGKTGTNVTGGTISGINYSFASGSSPTIIGTATATAFTTTYGTASSLQTFSVSGSNLTANITATAPTGFEVSSDGTTYGSTATFTQSSGSASGSLRIRLAATAAVGGTYNSQTIALTSTGATTVNITSAASGNTVSAASLTVIASNQSRNYNTTSPTSGTLNTNFTVSGLKNSDAVSGATLGYANGGNLAAAAVGTYTITPSAVTFSTGTSGNYSISYTTGTLTVNALQLTAPSINSITGGDNTLSVAFTAPSNSASTGSSISNYKYSINGGSSFTAFSPAQTTSPLSISSGVSNGTTYDVQILAVNSFGDGNASSTTQGTPVATPTINATATLSAFTTTYGTASSAQNFAVSGSHLNTDITATAPTGFQVSNDGSTYGSTATFTQSSGNASGTLYVRLAATATVGGSYNSQNIAFTSTGATTVNVTTSASGNTVSTKGLTITGLSASNKDYDGGTTVSVTGTPAYSGLENGEAFSISGTPSWAFTTKTAGTAKAITQTGSYAAPSSNYTVTQPSLTANINTIALTISGASVTSKQYDGSTSATITGTLTGVISPDVVSFTGTGTFASANASTGISVTASCTLTGADKDNYTLTQPTSLTGDINKADQTITFAALSNKLTTDASFALTGTASSGLTVSYSSSNTGVATVSGSTVTIVGAGTTTITASQTGDGNYNAATSVDRTLTVTAPDLVEVIFPQYAVNGTTTASRLQYVCRLTLNNLTASATYRYTTQASLNGSTAGNMFVINNSSGSAGYVTGYTSSKSLAGTLMGSTTANEFASAARYGEFTTDGSGSYTGWFSIVPTSNAVFNAGNNIRFNVVLNDGNGGTTAAKTDSSSSTIKMINPATGINGGQAVKGASYSGSESMVFLYDNTSGTGRPIAGNWTEDDGITTSMTTWYESGVTGSGSWGTYIPVALSNGIRKIEYRNTSDNSVVYSVTDNDGNWNGTVNTVNPTGGTTALSIPTSTFDDATFNSNISLSASSTINGTLTINSGKALSIGAGNTLTVNAFSGTGTISTTPTSNLTINGSAGTAYFTSGANTLKNFTLGSSASATLGSDLNITAGATSGSVTIGTGATLTTGGHLILKSDANGTAKIAQSSGNISGDITVERYIPAKTTRKYSFIASPVTQSVANSWQQQTHITGPGTGGTTCQSAIGTFSQNNNGFDATGTNAASMFYFDQNVSGHWTTIPNTTSTNVQPGKGFRVLVRGSRALGCALLYSNPPAPDAVTLSATGTVGQGTISNIPVCGVVNGFTLLGNPYPADLNFTQFQSDNSSVIANKFWAYSPEKGGGVYATYVPNVGNTNFSTGYANHQIIASGQAFFVENISTASSVTFNEAQKAGTQQTGMFKNTNATDRIRVSLYSNTNNTNSIDEALVDFNTSGSASYNPDWDAKTMNSGTYIASMKAGNKLAIQSRPMIPANNYDTIALYVDGTVANYNLGFTEHTQFNGNVYLLDKFTNTLQDVKLNAAYPFTISTDTTSRGANRFALVFSSATPLSINSINVVATANNNNSVQVQWTTEKETAIQKYEVERAENGIDFNKVTTITSKGNDGNNVSYQWNDASPLSINYYRVKGIELNGQTISSDIVMVKLGKANNEVIKLYPNPINGETAQLQLNGADAGDYSISIYNTLGQIVYRQEANFDGSHSITLHIPASITNGSYNLSLSNGNKQYSQTIIINK